MSVTVEMDKDNIYIDLTQEEERYTYIPLEDFIDLLADNGLMVSKLLEKNKAEFTCLKCKKKQIAWIESSSFQTGKCFDCWYGEKE